ncbi:hypothetical protein CTI14_39835, partial [Methylobacterium radiotolerans]
MARTDPQVNFRMPADLKEQLEEAAKKHGRSVTQEIIQRLDHSFTPCRADIVDRSVLQPTASGPKAGARESGRCHERFSYLSLRTKHRALIL